MPQFKTPVCYGRSFARLYNLAKVVFMEALKMIYEYRRLTPIHTFSQHLPVTVYKFLKLAARVRFLKNIK